LGDLRERGVRRVGEPRPRDQLARPPRHHVVRGSGPELHYLHLGRYLYFTSDRSFADKPLEAALSTPEWNARLDGPGNGLGDTRRVPMAAVFETTGRTPR